MARFRIVPTWLRPLTLAAVVAAHGGVLIGFAWPDADTPAVTAPIAVQVVPQGTTAQAFDAPREVQVDEVTAMAAAAAEARAAQVPDTEPVETRALQTSEPPSDHPDEIHAAETPPVGPQASLQAIETPAPHQDAIPEPPARPKPRATERKRQDRDKTSSPAQTASRASAVARAEAVTGSIASATYRSIVAAELNRRKFYPPSARAAGLEGVVVMSFTIGGDGHVHGHSIVRSSGQPALDQAARQMMAAIALPPPPGGTFRATVPIQYSIRD